MSYNGFEPMPIWAPPTPPQDENDIYIDYSLAFLYEQIPIPDSALPPVYVSKESNKRLKLDPTTSRKQKARKEEGFSIPRSLFDRPSTAIIKLRRELILQKLKGVHNPDSAAIHRTLHALGGNAYLPPINILPSPAHKVFAGPLQDSIPNWVIHEDWAIIQVLQNYQDLPLGLSNISPGHIPNWDLVSDVVNVVSCNYRSPKLCRYHYEVAIVPREEGKPGSDSTNKPKQKKVKGLTTTSVGSSTSGAPSPAVPSSGPNTPKVTAATLRPMKTGQMIGQDNNLVFSQSCNSRFETIKQIANKRSPTLKHMFNNSTSKNPKHIAMLTESGINFDHPLTPLQVAANRAERIQREKQKAAAEQQQLAARQQLQQLQQQQKHQQNTQPIKTILSQSGTMPTAQHQLSQAISAKISQISQINTSNLKAVSGVASTAVTQLSLNKALSQVSQQSLPQPILGQINISPQTMGTTNVTTEGIPQQMQQTCSVVSVAALTPQAHQKLIAAVSQPSVSQIGGQTLAGRLTTTNPQIYKQIILRQQQQQQQQQQIQRQQSPQLQMQAIPQNKQLTSIGVGQQQPRFQIATVSQSGQPTTQSIIATSGIKTSQPNIVTTLPVAVPMSAAQQRIMTTATGKPTQQIITRTITDPQLAQIIKRQQLQQSSGNLGQTQILVQQSSPQTQSTQSQILQNPVTFVKTLSSPATMATQSLTIPVTMTGMNIFTSPVTKVMSPTPANPSTSGITSVPATQLRQIQLLSQKRPQQTTQVIQQQLQNQLSQQLGQQSGQKITTATIGAQQKGVAQLHGQPVGTFQIVHQSSPSMQNTKTVPTTVTVQQLQQAIKQGLVVGQHNINAIHVSQAGTSSTTSTTTLIPQSILQAVSQSKAQTIESSQQQNTPIAVAQIGPNQQTIKHIQVVSSASPQSQTSGGPKSIILSGQPILQTSMASQPQTQTLTFAIRAAQQSPISQQTPQSSQTNTTTTAESPGAVGSAKESEGSDQSDSSNQSGSRQSPYATRHRNPPKN